MRRAALVPLALVGLAVTACSSPTSTATTPSPAAQTGATTSGPATQAGALVASGALVNPSGGSLGTVEFRNVPDGMQVTVRANGLTPGFHAVHLHAIGKCEPNSADPSDPSMRGNFNSAGGHLTPGEGDHPNHDGDLPALLVVGNGTGSLTAVTDRLSEPQLADQDGTAFIVHERPDNAANIPSRYASAGPDAETKKAGDAGPRVACAVIRRP